MGARYTVLRGFVRTGMCAELAIYVPGQLFDSLAGQKAGRKLLVY